MFVKNWMLRFFIFAWPLHPHTPASSSPFSSLLVAAGAHLARASSALTPVEIDLWSLPMLPSIWCCSPSAVCFEAVTRGSPRSSKRWWRRRSKPPQTPSPPFREVELCLYSNEYSCPKFIHPVQDHYPLLFPKLTLVCCVSGFYDFGCSDVFLEGGVLLVLHLATFPKCIYLHFWNVAKWHMHQLLLCSLVNFKCCVVYHI